MCEIDAMAGVVLDDDLKHVRFDQHLPRRIVNLLDKIGDPGKVTRQVFDHDAVFRLAQVGRAVGGVEHLAHGREQTLDGFFHILARGKVERKDLQCPSLDVGGQPLPAGNARDVHNPVSLGPSETALCAFNPFARPQSST